MAIAPVIPGAAGGAVTGQRNMGLPVMGNMAGRNQYSPPLGTMTQPVAGTTKPVGLPGAISGQPPVNAPGMNMVPHPTALGASPVAGGGVTSGGNPLAAGNAPAGLDPNISKQLTDIYGKGVGGALATMLQNLGGQDSSYLNAYKQAMQGQQAEDISTIGTSLGNAGISANSSTSAIEKGDYLAKSNAQLGLQEQQLLQTQQGEAINLLQGTQQSAQAETSSSWLDTLGSVTEIAGTFVGDATGLSSIGSGIKSVASMIPGMGGSSGPPNIAAGGLGEGQLGNPFTTGSLQMPGMPSQAPSLPSLGV